MADETVHLDNAVGLGAWILAGGGSWYLSTYIFSGVMLPAAFNITTAMNDAAVFQWAVPALKILIPHTPQYLLNFVFCLVLGRKSRVTIFRLAGFVIAANGVCLYYHLLQLAGYTAHGGAPSGRNWILLGMTSTLVISPLFALLGCLAGRAVRK